MDAAPWLPNLARLQLTECGTPGDGGAPSAGRGLGGDPPKAARPNAGEDAPRGLQTLPIEITTMIAAIGTDYDCRDIVKYFSTLRNLREEFKSDIFWEDLCQSRGFLKPGLSDRALNALILQMPAASQNQLRNELDPPAVKGVKPPPLRHKVLFVVRCILLPTPYLERDADLVVCPKPYDVPYGAKANTATEFDYAYDKKNRMLVLLDKQREWVRLPWPNQLALAIEDFGDGSRNEHYCIETLVLPMRSGMPFNTIPADFFNEDKRFQHSNGESDACLKAVRHLKNIDFIGARAFQSQHQLDLTLPPSLKTIGDAAFQGCTNLTLYPDEPIELDSSEQPSEQLPDQLRTIGYAAFADCAALRTLTLPASLEGIGDDVFSNCHRSLEVTFKKSIGLNDCPPAWLFDEGHPMIAKGESVYNEMVQPLWDAVQAQMNHGP